MIPTRPFIRPFSLQFGGVCLFTSRLSCADDGWDRSPSRLWRFPSFLMMLAAATVCLGASSARSEQQSPPACIWPLGDSLTGGYQLELAKILPERRVIMGGRGGQTSTQIAARAGARPTRASVSGDSIPDSGAVQVTAISPRVISDSGKFAEIAGTFAGRPGKLTRDSADQYSFTPAPAAAKTAVPPNSPFVPDTHDSAGCIVILWAGQNNMPAVAQILSDTDAVLAPYVRQHRPFLVIGQIPDERELVGTIRYRARAQINAALMQRYGANYVDLRAYLVERGLKDANIEPDAHDLENIANGVVPHSLRQDYVHFTSVGFRLVAEYLAATIKDRRW